jgi:PAS domain S-box-containing protein
MGEDRSGNREDDETEELRRRLAAVEHELKVKTLHLEMATDGYFDWDLRNPEHEYLSPKFWRNFGYDPKRKTHSPSEWMDIIHPEDKEVALSAFKRHVERGEPYHVTLRYRHAKGHWEWVVCRGQAFLGDDGKPFRFVGTHQSITDLKRAEAALEQFAFHAAHDLKEPLRKIVAFGERLDKYRDNVPDRGQLYLDKMLDASLRMSNLIDDLLEYARVSRDEKEMVAVDLEKIIDGLAQDYSTKLREAEGEISVSGLSVVSADWTQMRQLLQNLISNAIKFRRKDAPLEIRVSGREIDGMLEVRFSDNGIGFDEQYREKIFQVFQRLHGRMEYEGTGIGLAVCARVVQSHCGTIWAESREGEGATFVFTLPLKKVNGEA